MIVSLKKYITYVTKKSNTNIYKTKKKNNNNNLWQINSRLKIQQIYKIKKILNVWTFYFCESVR